MTTPLINGVNYSWRDISFVLFGVPVVGITKISYKAKQKKDNNYGAGYDPISRGYGNKEYECSIEIYKDELNRIIAAAPNNDLLAISPFDVQVSYEKKDGTVVTDVLQACEFTEDSIDASQGDTKISVSLPFIIAGIIHK